MPQTALTGVGDQQRPVAVRDGQGVVARRLRREGYDDLPPLAAIVGQAGIALWRRHPRTG